MWIVRGKSWFLLVTLVVLLGLSGSLAFAVTLSAPTLLAPPNGAIDVSQTPTLSWSAVTGATGYQVQLSTVPDFSSSAVILPTGKTQLPLPLLFQGKTYYWRVRAVAGGLGGPGWVTIGPWSDGWSFTTLAVTLAAPVLTAPANGAPGLIAPILLQWGAVTGATAYQVQVSKVPDLSSGVINLPAVQAQTKLYFVPAGTTLYWRVRAVAGGSGTPLTLGPWSGIWSFTTA